MEKQYIFILVLNDMRKFKPVKKKLISLDYRSFTVLDSMGSIGNFYGMEFTNMFHNALSESDGEKNNKTILLVLQSEPEVITVMDELEQVLNIDRNKPGNGIMFTIPIIKSHGVRFE